MAKLKVVRDPKQIERDWETNPRWNGVTRSYTAAEVLKLRGSIDVEYTLAELGQDAGHVAEQAVAVERLDLELHEEDAGGARCRTFVAPDAGGAVCLRARRAHG